MLDVVVEVITDKVGCLEEPGEVVIELFHEDGIGFVTVAIAELSIHEVVEEPFKGEPAWETAADVTKVEIGDAVIVSPFIVEADSLSDEGICEAVVCMNGCERGFEVFTEILDTSHDG